MKLRAQDGFIPEREEFDLPSMRFLRRPGSYMTIGPNGPREVVMNERWRWSPSVEAYVPDRRGGGVEHEYNPFANERLWGGGGR
jgi:hypothetical protein